MRVLTAILGFGPRRHARSRLRCSGTPLRGIHHTDGNAVSDHIHVCISRSDRKTDLFLRPRVDARNLVRRLADRQVGVRPGDDRRICPDGGRLLPRNHSDRRDRNPDRLYRSPVSGRFQFRNVPSHVQCIDAEPSLVRPQTVQLCRFHDYGQYRPSSLGTHRSSLDRAWSNRILTVWSLLPHLCSTHSKLCCQKAKKDCPREKGRRFQPIVHAPAERVLSPFGIGHFS